MDDRGHCHVLRLPCLRRAVLPARGPDSALLEGSENAGITILGDAPDDQAMSGDMSQIDPATVTEVTLISTIEAKPVETTDAVAVTQVEKAEIVEPLLPEATAVETLEPVEPWRSRAA